MDSDLLEKIKKLTIIALVSDDALMGVLVLKGGNALNIGYEISTRGSLDIDFSIESDYTAKEKVLVRRQAEYILNKEFNPEGLVVFDVKFHDRPQKIDESVKDFWGGYLLEFKIIEAENFDKFSGDHETIRRNAIQIGRDNSTKFTVDISKYEYIGQKRPIDLEGATVYVYSPEMIVLEKLRALCQQVPAYKKIIKHMTPKTRARDFYDIFNLMQHFSIDFKSKENIELARDIFAAKKVPLSFILQIDAQRELHRGSWESVIQTINQQEELKEFDFYYDFVLENFSHLVR
ncbi:MAG TPA: nucleotidyl transferase AbiEii/AbiGii toxin family protein [Candidatus Cloacimonadota bacterium]|nr:nucleotidyl transferase AbiEii/AbiGii toxin family protein [Candidatus Cloacimonadota bacterium]